MSSETPKKCPLCSLPKAQTREQVADNPEELWCECPFLEARPYPYGEEDAPSLEECLYDS
jgi:hypothetical protein